MTELEELRTKCSILRGELSELNQKIRELELLDYYTHSGIRTGSIIEVNGDRYIVDIIRYPSSMYPTLRGRKYKLNGEPGLRTQYIHQGRADTLTVVKS